MPDAIYSFELDDLDDASDAIEVLALGPFLRGDLRWARSRRLHRVKADSSLLPLGAVASRESVEDGCRTVLAEGAGWLVRVRRWDDRTADLMVVAADAELGARLFEEASAGATEDAPADQSVVPIGFWHHNGQCPDRRTRAIAAPEWGAISRNYTAPVAQAFERLMALDPAALSGRVLLLHGPPGTGKTTALRALAQAWRSWCGFDYVLDPERLLRDPGYLMHVALSRGADDDAGDDTGDGEGDEATSGKKRWRLLLMEDCDEVLRATAKAESGQALSRLLNLTDGLLGQGIDLLLAITTNEPVTSLHPAVVRPGRCLADIHVGSLTATEARRWLRRPVPIAPEGATLAQLFALQGDLAIVRDAPTSRRAAGQYL